MIAIACDHGGYELKLEILDYLRRNNIAFKDFGCDSTEAVDYPVYAREVTAAINENSCDKGILICGTGIGISIAANKVPGIRCALCTDCFCAEATRQHNDSNVLALGGRTTGLQTALDIVAAWVDTEFEGGRHQRRVDMLDAE